MRLTVVCKEKARVFPINILSRFSQMLLSPLKTSAEVSKVELLLGLMFLIWTTNALSKHNFYVQTNLIQIITMLANNFYTSIYVIYIGTVKPQFSEFP